MLQLIPQSLSLVKCQTLQETIRIFVGNHLRFPGNARILKRKTPIGGFAMRRRISTQAPGVIPTHYDFELNEMVPTVECRMCETHQRFSPPEFVTHVQHIHGIPGMTEGIADNYEDLSRIVRLNDS
jgi:hypothetical protein